MIKKLFLLTFCTLFLFASSDDVTKKNSKACKKQNELLKENKIDANFLDEIINTKADDFKNLKDENRKDKMKECD